MMLSPGAIGAVSEVARRRRLLPREPRARSTAPRSALYAKGEPVDAITLVDELEERGELEDVGGRVAHPRARRARPGDARTPAHYARIVREMATLRGLIRAGGEIARLGWERPGETHGPRRPRRAGRLRPLAGARHDRVQPHRGAAEGELRADHRALRGGRRRHRRRRPASATSTGSRPASSRAT